MSLAFVRLFARPTVHFSKHIHSGTQWPRSAYRVPLHIYRNAKVRPSSVRREYSTGWRTYYKPEEPKRDWRSLYTFDFLYRVSSERLIYILMGINAVIFAVFWLSREAYANNDRWWPVSLNTMFKHFTLSVQSVAQGRIHTLVTSAFAHVDPMHFIMNMVGLYSFGSGLAHMLDAKRLLGLYMAGAVGGSVAHVLWSAYNRPRDRNAPGRPALGASGAINALCMFYAVMRPNDRFFLFFIPLPAWIAAGSFVMFDLYNALQRRNTGIGHSAHLGGAAVGLLYGLYLKRGRVPFGRRW